MHMCHMMADTMEELHGMADSIGVSREHYQDTKYKHYDICKSNRAKAIARGAIEVTSRDLIRMFKKMKVWYKTSNGFQIYCMLGGWGVGFNPITKELLAQSDVDGIDFTLEDLDSTIEVLEYIKGQVK